MRTIALGMLPAGIRPTTRESCLECVEKHLGSALVLSAEERDGYQQTGQVPNFDVLLQLIQSIAAQAAKV